MGDDVDISTESLGPKDGEVTKTTDTDNTDLLAWTGTKTDERAVDGQTGAELVYVLAAAWDRIVWLLAYHRSSDLGWNVVWNLKGEVLVGTHVRRVTTLCDGTIWVWSAVGVDHVWAVVLLVSLAVVASQVGTNLGTNTDTVADPEMTLDNDLQRYCVLDILDGLDVLADLDGATDDLVTNTEWERSLTPATSDGVDIGTTDTTGVNGNVNVAVLERLELELCNGSVKAVQK